MVKKLQAIADGKDEGSPLASAIRESAEKIWLAGLGAFAKARQEPTRAFETLVREGLSLQSRTRAMAGERFDEVSDKVNAVKSQLSARATDSWDKLEQVFEDRVSRSLARLGVPSRDEVQVLIDRVDELTQALEALGGQLPKPRPRRPGSATLARSTSTRAATAGKTAAKGAKGAKGAIGAIGAKGIKAATAATAARGARGARGAAPALPAKPRVGKPAVAGATGSAATRGPARKPRARKPAANAAA